MTLKRLSLSVLRPGEAAAAATQPGVAPAGPDRRPAAFTRQNVRLVLATRLQVSKLSAVEAVLLGESHRRGGRGCGPRRRHQMLWHAAQAMRTLSTLCNCYEWTFCTMD